MVRSLEFDGWSRPFLNDCVILRYAQNSLPRFSGAPSFIATSKFKRSELQNRTSNYRTPNFKLQTPKLQTPNSQAYLP
jgi:hypothetical protein